MKKVKFEIDTESSTLRIEEGRLFLGTDAVIEFAGWTPDTENHQGVITLFKPGSSVPIAQSAVDGETVKLNLSGNELRKAFHGEAAPHVFRAFLNQRYSTDGGETWNWKPDMDAVGDVIIEWSPAVFEISEGALVMATLKGPPGQDGQDGKSAYQLAVEKGYTGTLEEWLASFNISHALTGKAFDFTNYNAVKFADAIKAIFEALGGTVQ